MGGAARQHLPEPTGLWRVPGAHVDAVSTSPNLHTHVMTFKKKKNPTEQL